ncbi:MAG: hypothetical protein QXN62_06985 [Candidatus Bathyarchaeia archaeon]|nr:hypothetical protein [Candidatus Bathyarchaeota archaeon]
MRFRDGTFEGLIIRVVDAFNFSILGYMITGALAASYYDVSRTTMLCRDHTGHAGKNPLSSQEYY